MEKIPNDIKSNYKFSKFKKQLSKLLLSFNNSNNINNCIITSLLAK